jgi:hypothetical protein
MMMRLATWLLPSMRTMAFQVCTVCGCQLQHPQHMQCHCPCTYMGTQSVHAILLRMTLTCDCRLSCMAVWQSSHCTWPSTHRYVSQATLELVFTIRTSSPFHGCLPLLTTAVSHVQAVVRFWVQVIVEQAFSGNLDHVKHALVRTTTLLFLTLCLAASGLVALQRCLLPSRGLGYRVDCHHVQRYAHAWGFIV